MRGFPVALAVALLAPAACLPAPDESFPTQRDLAAVTAAAAAGEAAAQYDLGRWHKTGVNGLIRNDREAVLWYARAAAQGHAEAAYALGLAYDRREGVEQALFANAMVDLPQTGSVAENLSRLAARVEGYANRRAYIWFAVAAALGHEEAVLFRDQRAEDLGTAALDSVTDAAQACLDVIRDQADRPPARIDGSATAEDLAASLVRMRACR